MVVLPIFIAVQWLIGSTVVVSQACPLNWLRTGARTFLHPTFNVFEEFTTKKAQVYSKAIGAMGF